MPAPQGLGHRIGIDRFDTDDFCFWPKLLDVGRNPCDQAPTTNGDVNRIRWLLALPHDFHGNGALTSDDLWVVEGVDVGQAFCFATLLRFRRTFVVGLAVQNHLTAQGTDGADFDLGSCFGHHDHRSATQTART